MGFDVAVKDFVIVCGNNVGEELGTYKVFNILGDPRNINTRKLLRLRAVDVPVFRGAGSTFFNILAGRHLVVGGLDLDRERECTISEDLFWLIKEGKPNVWFVLPDSYVDLPMSIKSCPLGEVLRMFYLQRESRAVYEESLREQGKQDSEITDMATQSMSTFNAMVYNNFKAYSDMLQKSGKEGKTLKNEGDGAGDNSSQFY